MGGGLMFVSNWSLVKDSILETVLGKRCGVQDFSMILEK
jgi:hypothetical protein